MTGENWQARHICLPSLIVAIALQAVLIHNNYLASWREAGQSYANWRGLGAQQHYILAVQYLQDAEYPYHDSADYEKELVDLIEKYRLYRYDEVKNSVKEYQSMI